MINTEFSDELINEALERTTRIPQPSVRYADAIFYRDGKIGIRELKT